MANDVFGNLRDDLSLFLVLAAYSVNTLPNFLPSFPPASCVDEMTYLFSFHLFCYSCLSTPVFPFLFSTYFKLLFQTQFFI